MAWGELGWPWCGVAGALVPASAACGVGGGAVRVSADWVVTVVSSVPSTVGMGSPGAGSRCWMGWPVDGVCWTGAPWGAGLTCGIDGRPPPAPELSPLPVPLWVPSPPESWESPLYEGGLPATGSGVGDGDGDGDDGDGDSGVSGRAASGEWSGAG
ncbi:hypothetical protein [Streptomyces sioyaensis]|uniref:hypothetical protein n=1 Tax=Streptomyces sioyaensis TaxID=67364 RepID=UPI001EEFAA8D|nr:hypothetical protein [Streptomyces sioyaensis]